jgi:hypothetical protein
MDFINLENRQESLDYLFLNFKIISQIKEGQKLRIRKFNGLDVLDIDNRIIYKYLRGFYGDNRDTTIIVIKNLVDLAYKITDDILQEEFNTKNENAHQKKSPFESDDDNTILFRKLVLEMENSLVGLENLRSTYTDDISMISMLDLIIGKIKLRIDKINALFKITHPPF